MRHRLDPLPSKDPDKVVFYTGRVAQWPKYVEDRANTQFHSDRSDMFERLVVTWRHHETDARFRDGLLDYRNLGVKIHTEGGQNIGSTGF